MLHTWWMMNTCHWRTIRHHGGPHLSHTTQMTWVSPKRHLWGLDVILGLGSDGDWGNLAHFGGNNPWIMEYRHGLNTIGLWRPDISFSNSMNWPKVPNISQEGGGIMFLGFLLCEKYELSNNIFLQGKDNGFWPLIFFFTLIYVNIIFFKGFL
jgi:hypothetical protein